MLTRDPQPPTICTMVILYTFFSFFAHLWWFGVGVSDWVCWGLGFQVVRFGACDVGGGASGFFFWVLGMPMQTQNKNPGKNLCPHGPICIQLAENLCYHNFDVMWSTVAWQLSSASSFFSTNNFYNITAATLLPRLQLALTRQCQTLVGNCSADSCLPPLGTCKRYLYRSHIA